MRWNSFTRSRFSCQQPFARMSAAAACAARRARSSIDGPAGGAPGVGAGATLRAGTPGIGNGADGANPPGPGAALGIGNGADGIGAGGCAVAAALAASLRTCAATSRILFAASAI